MNSGLTIAERATPAEDFEILELPPHLEHLVIAP